MRASRTLAVLVLASTLVGCGSGERSMGSPSPQSTSAPHPSPTGPPGRVPAAVVAAHVDSRVQGLGPFVELLSVRPGARIWLESAGLRQAFSVRSRTLVAQGNLDEEAWIFDASGSARLTLATCAPPYDAASGGYQNLAVVIAAPLGPPERS